MAQRVRGGYPIQPCWIWLWGDRKIEEESLLGLHKRVRIKCFFVFPIKPTRPSSTSPLTLPTSFPVPLNFSTQGCDNFFLTMTNSDQPCPVKRGAVGTCNPPAPDGSNDEGAKDECTNRLKDLVEEMVDSCQKQEWNEIAVSTRVGAGFPDSAKSSCGPCGRDLLRTYEGWLDSTGSDSASSDAHSHSYDDVDASTLDPQEDNDNDPTLNPSDIALDRPQKTYLDAVVEGVCGEGFVDNSTGSRGAVSSQNSSGVIQLGAKVSGCCRWPVCVVDETWRGVEAWRHGEKDSWGRELMRMIVERERLSDLESPRHLVHGLGNEPRSGFRIW
ncbi:hypothetical protein D9758_018999 [Tetrapyrgos nigripes]|uniref:Uncharacterized protein n=1 Tax=Tetrapyrgos nigripes TaxID=182062 RepID=A0A8H5ESV0_9AGAR|nr:hypothetical protein D9758_018999 [Tetrapyrgos nigripes]